MKDLVYVEVRESGTGAVVTRLGPMSARKAEKVERGLEIQMDHDRYYTETVPINPLVFKQARSRKLP